METSQVEGVPGEGLSVELDKFTVPFLGELPDNVAWYFHESLPMDELIPYLLAESTLPLLIIN